jgi:hypothetical protein
MKWLDDLNGLPLDGKPGIRPPGVEPPAGRTAAVKGASNIDRSQ